MNGSGHDSLIDQLVADAKPVRLLPSLRVGVAATAAVWLAMLGVLMLTLGPRPELAHALSTPLYGLVFAALVVMGLTGAVAGLAAVVPGRERLSRGAAAVAAGAFAAAVLVCLADLVWGAQAGSGPGLSKDMQCFAMATSLSVVPVAGLLAYSLRGWAGSPATAATFVLVGGLALGACAVHLVCGVDGVRHVMLGHLDVPGVVTAVLVLPFATLVRRFAR